MNAFVLFAFSLFVGCAALVVGVVAYLKHKGVLRAAADAAAAAAKDAVKQDVQDVADKIAK